MSLLSLGRGRAALDVCEDFVHQFRQCLLEVPAPVSIGVIAEKLWPGVRNRLSHVRLKGALELGDVALDFAGEIAGGEAETAEVVDAPSEFAVVGFHELDLLSEQG